MDPATDPYQPASDEVPQRKRAIVRTARKLFGQFGFKRVTVEEICRQTGASKATFYKYFDNKVGLVKHLLEGMSRAYHRKLDEVEQMELPFADKVRILVDDQLRRARRTSDAFVSDFYSAGDDLAAFVDQVTARNQRRLLAFIGRAQERGDVRPDIRLEFILAMLEKLNELAGDEALRRHYADTAELTREIIDFFFYGLLSSRAG
jgi:AcrR family transcriptional regulator